jgi:hypothetical protein
MFLNFTPDTSSYMIAGYITFFVVIGAYILSLAVLCRNSSQELTKLQDVINDSSTHVI